MVKQLPQTTATRTDSQVDSCTSSLVHSLTGHAQQEQANETLTTTTASEEAVQSDLGLDTTL